MPTAEQQNRRQNHLALFESYLKVRRRLRRKQLVRTIVLAPLLLLGFVGAEASGLFSRLDLRDPGARFVLPVGFFVAFIAFFLLVRRLRVSRVRAAYATALRHPDPSALTALDDRNQRKAARVPDADAVFAQSRAMGLAFYGREAEALSALAAVDWARRAPHVRAVGHTAEGVVALLCRRDPERALEAAREARSLMSIGKWVPRAAKIARVRETYVAVAEAFVGPLGPEQRRLLEEAASKGRQALLRVLAAFALAADSERAGDDEGAAALRALVREAAPHCAPLQLGLGDFARPSPETVEATVDAAAPQPEVSGYDHEAHKRSVRQALVRGAVRMAILWAVLIAFFVGFYVLNR